MAYNKFKTKDGVVLLDLTNDDVTPETLAKGVIAHDKHGEIITGTMEGSEMIKRYDCSVTITGGES